MPETVTTRGGFDSILVIWRRRKWLALSVFAAAVAIAAGVTAFLPDRYRATVTFLVERQELEEAFMRPGAGDDMETRLQTVGQRILSRSRLEDLIRRFNLYPELRAKGVTTEGVIEQMRREVRLVPKGADTPGGSTTVALGLSYSGSNPTVAALVANTIAASYVDDDVKSRQSQAGEAARFLKVQLDIAKTRYEESSTSQARLMDRKRALSRPLGSLEPVSGPDSVGARLAKLRIELVELKTRYKEQHPEVLRVQDEIRSLERQLASGAGVGTPQTRLDGATVQKLKESLAGVDAGLMSSDYETDKEHYLALVKRYEEARLNESMAQNQQGDQFRILDPAVVPEHPVAPNRVLLLIGGVALAAALAIGAVALAERLDTSFHTVGDLRSFTRIPILASIPRIATAADARRRKRQAFVGVLGAAVGLVLVIEVSYYLAGLFGPLILTLMGGRA